MAKAKQTLTAPTGNPVTAAEPMQDHAAAGLRITSARAGFRRAGYAWSVTPTEIPLAELSDDQVAMLKAEPMLTVEDITIEAAAE